MDPQASQQDATDERDDAVPVTFTVMKALASKPRFEILQALTERRMTVTELGETLEMEKGTVHSHMEPLVDAGLARRHDDERLWVYYSLTDLGGQIAASDRPRLILLVGASLVSLSTGGLMFGYARFLQEHQLPPSGDDDALPPEGPDLPFLPDLAPEEAWIPLVAAILLVAAAILLGSLAARRLLIRLAEAPRGSPQE